MWRFIPYIRTNIIKGPAIYFRGTDNRGRDNTKSWFLKDGREDHCTIESEIYRGRGAEHTPYPLFQCPYKGGGGAIRRVREQAVPFHAGDNGRKWEYEEVGGWSPMRRSYVVRIY